MKDCYKPYSMFQVLLSVDAGQNHTQLHRTHDKSQHVESRNVVPTHEDGQGEHSKLPSKESVKFIQSRSLQ